MARSVTLPLRHDSERGLLQDLRVVGSVALAAAGRLAVAILLLAYLGFLGNVARLNLALGQFTAAAITVVVFVLPPVAVLGWWLVAVRS